MRALFFNYEYPPLGAGAGNASFFILKEYAKMSGLQVDFVTSSHDNEFHLEKVGENIFVHRLPIGKNKKNMHYQSQKDLLVYSWKAYFYSKKLIKKNEYDLSHSFFTVPCGFLSLIFKWQYKIPYVVSLRGADVPGFSDRFSLFYTLFKPLIRLVWSRSSTVISCSAGLKNLAGKTDRGQKIDVIYNGINIEEFRPKNEARPAGKIIITTGATRLTTRKSIEDLLNALVKIVKKNPQVEARLMGEGDDKANLESLSKHLKIENNVKFLGRIPREEIYKYYQEASIFIMTSLNEGMSNAMLEALGSGLPIISTPTGGAEELVKDGINGYLIKFKNSGDIAEKLEKMLNDPELRERMGVESRKIAEGMSWEKAAREYVDVYKKLIKESRKTDSV